MMTERLSNTKLKRVKQQICEFYYYDLLQL